MGMSLEFKVEARGGDVNLGITSIYMWLKCVGLGEIAIRVCVVGENRSKLSPGGSRQSSGGRRGPSPGDWEETEGWKPEVCSGLKSGDVTTENQPWIPQCCGHCQP